MRVSVGGVLDLERVDCENEASVPVGVGVQVTDRSTEPVPVHVTVGCRVGDSVSVQELCVPDWSVGVTHALLVKVAEGVPVSEWLTGERVAVSARVGGDGVRVDVTVNEGRLGVRVREWDGVRVVVVERLLLFVGAEQVELRLGLQLGLKLAEIVRLTVRLPVGGWVSGFVSVGEQDSESVGLR